MLSAGSVHFKVVNFDSLPIEFCQYLEPHKNHFLSNIFLSHHVRQSFNYNFSL